MPDFKEDLLQFIWQYKLIKPLNYISTTGKEITILRPGELNRDSGPDFFNAQIKVNGIILAGNIELHLKTSDWRKHKHEKDKNYDNIILHVVYENDEVIQQNKENGVEVLELKKYMNSDIIEKYNAVFSNKEKLPCSRQLNRVEDIKFISWLERMAIERLEEKTKRLELWHKQSFGDYNQTFYISLLRAFGFKTNAQPFEMLALTLPVQLLLKHTDNLFQLEALLLGIAGFLDQPLTDKYIRSLQNEFEYLKNKYHLAPLKKEIFKFSKLRPANFPTLRLAQLAMLIHSRPNLFSYPHKVLEYRELNEALLIKMEGYWKNHYHLDGESTIKELSLGKESIEKLMINAFAPFFFFYGKKLKLPEYEHCALELLDACDFENNHKTKLFFTKSKIVTTAANSQALIHLYDHYCLRKKCLACGIGAAILN